MKPSTLPATAAGAVVLLAVLAGCGGDSGDSGASAATSTEDYCSALEDAKADFEGLDQGGAEVLGDLDERLDAVRALADMAPEEIADDWATMIATFDKFEQAVQAAGLTIEDLAAIAQGDPSALPEDVNQADIQALGLELAKLNSTEFTKATEAITAYSEKECGISLDDGGATP